MTYLRSANFSKNQFSLYKTYLPSGDQPKAIDKIVYGLKNNFKYQTLLGVTGSGKTYTMANIIAAVNRPAIILAPNKTLAAQIYSEMKNYFPNNAVEYFVSYYDYYQPEAYVPSKDMFIEKDASINAHIEQMRLSATKSVMERSDTIIVSTVSCIYCIGNPRAYLSMVLFLRVGDKISRYEILEKLVSMQYERNDIEFSRGKFRVRGDYIDIFPSENAENAIRITIFDEKIDNLQNFDPLNGRINSNILRYTVYPSSHYVAPKETIKNAIKLIKEELKLQIDYFMKNNQFLEAQRLEQRTMLDIESLVECNFCKGIENYSRHLYGSKAGEALPTLIDYLPKDVLIFIDESHITVGQLRGMYLANLSRKNNLIQHGFRLPSALDNRPLKLEEFESKVHQCIFVSATPSEYEKQKSEQIIEQIVRPTGILDPVIEVRPAINQIDDLISQIKIRIQEKEKILVTTLTKKIAEELTEFLLENNIKVRYLHSDVNSIERVQIIKDLRLGIFDVLIGINLLREGLDIPEVSLVAILDADKEGFLRSERSLIQTIGRAARNLKGYVIMYADNMTDSMLKAINETNRRRQKQIEFNIKNNIVAKGIIKDVKDMIEISNDNKNNNFSNVDNILNKYSNLTNTKKILKEIEKLEKIMMKHAKNLEFEKAATIKELIEHLKSKILFS
ncbi:UvrABC system protein B [Candidatus Kinetoplastibacterium sorsogonicusi]|uniref:UvrABC system protein B n=1 Tax=Candidatus Kinetoplastidibacterium kentomonadis TaxID=1576550 RepID=A0A3Q8ERE7_9PROT|nr:excinuclease ABC subunit UvrB [Candidatus Kinetoplastibacterium sorsogonicusi]AWD32358.1 UvrABC system protein B [Candidatus Kinetoplastibacterium sorsogonicusi]